MIFNLVVLLHCSSCLLWCLSDRMDIYTLNQKSSHFSLSMTKMSKMKNANLPSHDRLPMPFMYLHSAAHQRASYLMHGHINSLPQFLFIDLCFSLVSPFTTKIVISQNSCFISSPYYMCISIFHILFWSFQYNEGTYMCRHAKPT